MSHPGLENEDLLFSLSQKNWGPGHGRFGRPEESCGWELSCFHILEVCWAGLGPWD